MMKKFIITLVLSIMISFSFSASTEAATKAIKKTVVEGTSCTIRTPKAGKKISSVSVAKSGRAYLSAKRVSGKKAVKLTGKAASDKPITVTVKVGKKKYKYSVSVVALPTTPSTTTTTTTNTTTTTTATTTVTPSPKDTTKTYHNNGDKCSCGGDWEKTTITETYTPSCWYLGYAENLKRDAVQTWSKYEMTTDCYYPLRVSAVEDGYKYDHTDLNWRGYDGSPEAALAKGTIPKTLNGIDILQGSVYPLTAQDYPTYVQWTTDRGGQVAKISLGDFKQSQVVDTGYCRCNKCGAIKQ